MPKSYGEAKTRFNQEAHIFYYIGRLPEQQGRTEQALCAYEEAAETEILATAQRSPHDFRIHAFRQVKDAF